jgi:vacuolar-type H+-ATPase subunit I/STV1
MNQENTKSYLGTVLGLSLIHFVLSIIVAVMFMKTNKIVYFFALLSAIVNFIIWVYTSVAISRAKKEMK